MDWTLEVIILPVADIDRSIAFYRDKVGFHLDHDTHNDHMHVVQLTPNGSGCSIVFGDLPAQREMAPGSIKGLQLVVSDAQAARQVCDAAVLSVGPGPQLQHGTQDGYPLARRRRRRQRQSGRYQQQSAHAGGSKPRPGASLP